MSNRAAVKAARNVGELRVSRQLFNFQFQPKPRPVNCCTFPHTVSIGEEWSHPFQIRTQRRLNAFDPNILHFTVWASLALSKKAVVRRWAERRVKEAFWEELKQQGWSRDGSVIDQESGRSRLKGALCVRLGSNKEILLAKGEEVRKECAWMLRKVIEAQR